LRRHDVITLFGDAAVEWVLAVHAQRSSDTGNAE
jgi:hypothetical protein